MSQTGARIIWNGGARFSGIDNRGLETAIDGDHKTAPSPVDLLLESIGSCAAVDVVVILEKVRTPASRLEVTVDVERHSPSPRYIVSMRIRFDIWGDEIRPEKAARAIQLSIVKYCTVFTSLRSDIQTTLECRLHQTGSEPTGDYFVVCIEMNNGTN